MKKTLRFLLVFLSLIFIITSRAYASPGSAFNVKINGSKTQVYDVNLELGGKKVSPEFKPYIYKDRTYVPVRLVAESFNSQVQWNQATKSAIISKGPDVIVLSIGKNEAIKNGEPISLPADQVPYLVEYSNGQAKTMVPLRIVSELLGYKISWNGPERLVSILEDQVPVQVQTKNQITAIEKINGSSKNEQIKISSTGNLDYYSRFEEEKNSLLLTIKDSSINIKGKTSGKISIGGQMIDSVEYSSDLKTKTSAIRIQLKTYAKANVKKVNKGQGLNISFTNEITGIRPVDYKGQKAILIENVQNSEYNIIKLNNPFRYVIDIKDASLLGDKKAGKFDISTGFVAGIRANQFVPDGNYSKNDNIVRVVLDSKEGVNDGKVQIIKEGFDLILIPEQGSGSNKTLTDPNEVPKNPINDEDQIDKEDSFDNVEEIEIVERKPRIKPNSKAEVVIVIDPGHGGKAPGALATNGTEEKSLNLDIALRAEEILSSYGYTVKMTRDSDSSVNIYQRPKFANEENAHAFVSIHANSSTNSEASGIETLYAPRDKTSVKYDAQYPLAQKIHYELTKETSMQSRGIKQRPDLIVLNQTEMSAVLVELGFISNEMDLDLMETDFFKDACAKAIANGLISYMQETYGY